ncbi:hypothetical protein D3C71_1028630 [compost metagenome]
MKVQELPSYLEDKKQIERFTSDWIKIEEEEETGISLWQFKDQVTRREERCIKDGNRILMSFHDYYDSSQMKVASRISLRAIASALQGGYVLYQP